MNSLIVETKNLGFSYGKSGKDIQGMDLRVPQGSIYGFLGPNGSGKSTTIRLILGLLKKHEGEVAMFGAPMESRTRLTNLSKVGALIENPSLYGHLSALENLRIAAKYRGKITEERIFEVLEIVKLAHVGSKKVKAFSLGMKQRLGLAIALLSNPELLILDEPTNGLDPKGIIEMRTLIKELNTKYGTTVFVSSHLLSEIEKTCSHVGIIRDGKMLYQDTVTALKNAKGDQLQVALEVDKFIDALAVLETQGVKLVENEDGMLLVEIGCKSDIATLIDGLRAKDVAVYQVVIKNSLEDLFLTLTEN